MTAPHLKSRDQRSELLFVYQHSYENVKFADQKALFLAPINIAALGASFLLIDAQNSLTAFLLIGAAFIAAGIALCGAVVWPRSPVSLFDWWFGAKSIQTGIVDPNKIARLKDAVEFEEQFESEGETFSTELYALIFKHCEIHLVKYRFLRLALAVSAIGWTILSTLAAVSVFL